MDDAVSFGDSVNKEELRELSVCEFDNIELDASRTCAYITALNNFMIYNINCLYCDKTFPIKNWNSFIEHVQQKHKLSEDEDFEDTTTAMEVSFKVEKSDSNNSLTGDLEREFLSERESSVGCDENEPDDFPLSKTDDTNSYKNLTSFPSTSRIENLLPRCKKTIHKSKKVNNQKSISNDLETEINVETTDESIVFGFIEAMRSYFRLWYTPKIKQASTERTFTEFYFKFMHKHQIKLKRRNMFDSVQNIRDWYQKMFENENFVTLKYPQNAYYHKLAEFLPDKLDGKSCEVCKRVLPDNLQHYAHKLQEHEEHIAAQQDPANLSVSGVPRTKIDEYLRARYPITEPLNFECQVCFEKIPARWKLINHIKTHIDVREYVCDICGLTFVQRIRLVKHRKRHLGEHVINCKICGEEFNDFSPLTSHRMKYHRPIEGTIEEIEKSFTVKVASKRGRKVADVFKSHIDPETSRKFYPCLFCNKRYSFQSGLSKHLNRSHKDSWSATKQKTNSKKD